MDIERFVAVDNVCAWPNLTKMPDGSIIATVFNQPTHGGWEGSVECWVSEDRGMSWSLRGIPAPHEPMTNRMNVAAGLAHDGSLIVLASGWSNRKPKGEYNGFSEANVLPMWICRSDDQGKTWTQSEMALSGNCIPFGDIVKFPNTNELGVCIYEFNDDSGSRLYDNNFYISKDDGKSWMKQGRIGENDYNETAPLVLDNGNIIVAARTGKKSHLEMFVSESQGEEWQNCGALTLGKQHPAHLLELNDGSILLTFGIRNQGLYGIGGRLSSDGGKTWDAPMVLLDFEIATDGGYPSSVQFEDGTIVTAYYCNKTPAHHRYHMGVIRWSL